MSKLLSEWVQKKTIAIGNRPSKNLRGGERGIRTLDTLLRCTHFPGALLKPLGHLSIISLRNCSQREIGRKIRIIFGFRPHCGVFIFAGIPLHRKAPPYSYSPNSPQMDFLSNAARREGVCSCAKTYIIFVTAASVVISLPLITPIFCNATPVS